MNVMVTCGGSAVTADAVSLIRRIEAVASILLVDCSGIDFDHGCASAVVPPGRSADYPAALRALVDAHAIDYIFVGSDEEALALSMHDWARRISHLDTFANTGLVLDKYRLHAELLRRCPERPLVPAFRACRTRQQIAEMVAQHGSVVARPVQGRGSRGLAHIVADDMAADYPSALPISSLGRDPDANTFYAAYLAGDKYSADCIFDSGVLLTCMVRNNGPAVKYRPPTMRATTSEDPAVHAFAGTVGQALSLSGFHQIECGKTVDGDVRLIEINPRMDATLPITKCFAHNFYELLMRREAVGLMTPRQRLFRRYFISYTR